MRHVLILEDRESVAFPESHAQGLIPFCQGNRLLRVERRFDLWRNIFQSGARSNGWNQMHRLNASEKRGNGLGSMEVVTPVARFIVEAFALTGPTLGMPIGSFTAFFDGGPASAAELCATIFDTTVRREAAWQIAIRESYARNLVSSRPFANANYFEQRQKELDNDFTHPLETYPRALAEIGNTEGCIRRCNFPVTALPSTEEVEDLIARHRNRPRLGGSSDAHKTECQARQIVKTVQPLPSWSDLLREGLTGSERQQRYEDRRRT
ncbi:Uu.00g088700.m01.CDS01 [Anthostomella pinea]|uniref:Uu.00g088700.m01.CDS01 n=1 Tax=Anthostomella pinea TaxID=933095 RepID=A0AAI8VML3_9PEZI|nr:Uu.00g088700.m01.CDS01 [Anthostomella pinea]